MPADLLTALDSATRNRLEVLLTAFDLAWTPGRLGDAVARLPSDGAFRLAALREMVKIDLERQWRSGNRPMVEDYLNQFPDLGAVTADLVRAEIAARREAESDVPHAEYLRRFPAVFAADASPTLPGLADTGPYSPGSPDLAGRFGRYDILRLLGRGGMGAVYLARDTALDRLVALKVPHLKGGDPEAAGRFAREAKAAATIEHPNVCRVYDAGQLGGRPFLTMAYVEGRTLADLLRDDPPGPRRGVEIVRTVARAVAEAHARGVVHRDLKPGNILMSTAGEPVVTDFGLARRDAADDTRLTESGVALGTPLYMSPEQMTGDTARVGPATDVYSLGVVLFQALTGQPPFGTSRSTVFAGTLSTDPPRPSVTRAGVHPSLDAIVVKALAKRPDDRFASMGEFADALDAWLRAAPPEPPTWKLWRVLAAAFGAAVLVAVVAVVASRPWAPPVDPPKGRTPATQPVDPPKGGPPVTPPPTGATAVPVQAGDEEIVAIGFDENDVHVYAAVKQGENVVIVQAWTAKDLAPKHLKYSTRFENTWMIFNRRVCRLLTGGGGPANDLIRPDHGAKQFGFPTAGPAKVGNLAQHPDRVILGITRPGNPKPTFAAVILDPNSSDPVGESVGHRDEVRCVALSDDGEWAFAASRDLYRLFEVGKPNNPPVAAGENHIVCATFLSDPTRTAPGRVALGSRTGSVALYDGKTLQRGRHLESASDSEVKCLATFGADRVACGRADGTVDVWDINTETPIWSHVTHPGGVVALGFGGNGRRLVTAGADRTWKISMVP